MDMNDHKLDQVIRRHKIIAAAISAADRIIMDQSDGSVEELDYLTAEMAHKWSNKVIYAALARLHKKELMDEFATRTKSEA